MFSCIISCSQPLFVAFSLQELNASADEISELKRELEELEVSNKQLCEVSIIHLQVRYRHLCVSVLPYL